VGYLTISINVRCYETHCGRQFSISATQRTNVAYDARNTVQLLQRKTLNFISAELWPQQPTAELN